VRSLPLSLALLLWCNTSNAEQAVTNVSARSRFDAGLAAIERGDFELALREFEAAYAVQPRYEVLFNIGQAQTALGRPIEAIQTFERFLAESGADTSESRRNKVRRLIEQNRKRTGTLALRVLAPHATRLWLDGTALATDGVSASIRLKVGEHMLLISHETGSPIERKVEIRPGETIEEVIPAPSRRSPDIPAPPAALGGAIAVECGISDIGVEVAGRPVGRTPLRRAVSVDPGRLRLSFSREGFVTVARDVPVSPGELARVACLLPLVPTPEKIERERSTSRKRVVGWGLLGGAVASLSASAVVFSWNQGRYDDWNSNRTAGNPMLDRATAIQRADDASLGLLMLGAGLGAAAVWNLLAD
jgi:hypothetical protein